MRKTLIKKQGKIFVVSGPSGSGKTTILNRLFTLKRIKNRITRSISFTTRPRRSVERDKRDYFFISTKEFRDKRKAKKILEWTKYLGYYYGTPRDFVEQQLNNGKNIVLCLDVRGALKIKRLYPRNVVTIFVMPPSLAELKFRIENRCKKTKEREIIQRLRLANKEILAAAKYDYRILNKNLNKVVRELADIMLREIKD